MFRQTTRFFQGMLDPARHKAIIKGTGWNVNRNHYAELTPYQCEENQDHASMVMDRYCGADPNFVSLSDSGQMPHDFVIFPCEGLAEGEREDEMNIYRCPHPYCGHRRQDEFPSRFPSVTSLIRHWNDYHVAVSSYYICPYSSCYEHSVHQASYVTTDTLEFKDHLLQFHCLYGDNCEIKKEDVHQVMQDQYFRMSANRRYLGSPNMEWCDKPLFDGFHAQSMTDQNTLDDTRRCLRLPTYHYSVMEQAYQQKLLSNKGYTPQYLVKWQVKQETV
jgi:hypothetical protein